MRIKTSNKVEEILDDLQFFLNVTTKAEVLQLAINLTLNSNKKNIQIIKENGFEIDTLVIFGSEHEYYEEIIKNFYKVEETTKEHYLNLIEIGIEILNVLKLQAKNQKDLFYKNLILKLEE